MSIHVHFDFFDCPDITLLLEVRDDNGNKFEAPE